MPSRRTRNLPGSITYTTTQGSVKVDAQTHLPLHVHTNYVEVVVKAALGTRDATASSNLSCAEGSHV